MNFDSDMIHLFREENLLDSKPELIVADEEKKVLIFRRKNFIFAFDFNPSGSFFGYAFDAPAGEWKLELDSDEKRYDGFERLKEGELHKSDGKLTAYLTSRCALVFRKTNAKTNN